MQEWRYRMEYAHIQSFNNSNFDIFGIFDGHGGKEVSKFVKLYFVQEFMNNKNTKRDDIPESLKEIFLKMDELLTSEKVKEELIKLNKYQKKKMNYKIKKIKKLRK